MIFKNFVKKQIVFIAFSVVCLLMVVLCTSYAIFMKIEDSDYQVITAGDLRVAFENGNQITSNNMQPLSDEQGKNQIGYTFSIINDAENGSTLPLKYTIRIGDSTAFFNGACDIGGVNYNATTCTTLQNSLVPHKYIKYQLIEGTAGKEVSTGTLECIPSSELASGDVEACLQNDELVTGTLEEAGDSQTYTLKVWLIKYVGSDGIKTLPASDIIGKEVHLELYADSEVYMHQQLPLTGLIRFSYYVSSSTIVGTVSGTPDDADLSYQWYKNDVILEGETSLSLTVSQYGDGTFTLKVSDKSGKYYGVIEDSYNRGSAIPEKYTPD